MNDALFSRYIERMGDGNVASGAATFINDFLAFLGEEGGGELVLPRPKVSYALATSLKVPASVSLSMPWSMNSKREADLGGLKPVGCDCAIEWLAVAGEPVDGARLRNLRIELTEAGQTGICDEAGKDITVQDCVIAVMAENCTGVMIDARGLVAGSEKGNFYSDYRNVWVLGTSAISSGTGIRCISGTSEGKVNRQNFRDIRTAQLGIGMHFTGGSSGVVTGSSAELMSRSSLVFDGNARSHRVYGFYAEGYEVTDVEFGPDTEFNEVDFTTSTKGGGAGDRNAEKRGLRNQVTYESRRTATGQFVIRRARDGNPIANFIEFQDENGVRVGAIDPSGQLI